MNKSHFTAVLAERLFGATILLLLIGLVIDFIFVTNFLKTEAVKTEGLHQQADATDSNIAKLKSANTWLKENDDAVKRTNAIVAESRLYQYQNQIIEDFNSYSRQTGVPIVGYSFIASSTAAASTAAPPPASSGAPGASSAPAAPPASSGAAKAPAGVNSTTVTVNFGNKVRYQNFLNLLRLLEQNVTRMQVTNISLAPDTTDLQLIINPTVTIIVYTR